MSVVLDDHKGWVGFDLDGTLVKWEGWKGIDHFGELIMPIVRIAREYLARGQPIKVFTARMSEEDPVELQKFKHAYRAWSFETFGQYVPVTNIKDYHMSKL